MREAMTTAASDLRHASDAGSARTDVAARLDATLKEESRKI
jgi:hypothetical protein